MPQYRIGSVGFVSLRQYLGKPKRAHQERSFLVANRLRGAVHRSTVHETMQKPIDVEMFNYSLDRAADTGMTDRQKFHERDQ